MSSPAKFSTRAAIPPSKPTFCSNPASWAVLPFPPAHPPAPRGDRAARRRCRSAYLGKGVLQAVETCNTEISEAIIGLDAEEQAFIDKP
jgi:hypothetical protein